MSDLVAMAAAFGGAATLGAITWHELRVYRRVRSASSKLASARCRAHVPAPRRKGVPGASHSASPRRVRGEIIEVPQGGVRLP